VSGPSLVKQARRQSAQYRGSPLTEHRETSSILGACANKIVAMETELATLRDDNARLREALEKIARGDYACLAEGQSCGSAQAAARAALAPQEPGR